MKKLKLRLVLVVLIPSTPIKKQLSPGKSYLSDNAPNGWPRLATRYDEYSFTDLRYSANDSS